MESASPDSVEAAADPIFVGAGDISDCSSAKDEETAKLLDSIVGTVFTVGDNVYPDGTLSQFNNCYHPTWGRHKARTQPVSGNHDYHQAGAAGYHQYFGNVAHPLTPNCTTTNCKAYYSFNLGAWHIIVLDSEIAMAEGSPQMQWLRSDLTANPVVCTLALWHKPRFSSGATHGGHTGAAPLWRTLYEFGADVVVNGHAHHYERFFLQDPDGKSDTVRGIREFIVGTGGKTLTGFGTIAANSASRSSTHGVLKLTLHATSYNWQFVPIAGKTFSDSGSKNCVGPSVPSATPTFTATATPVPTPTFTPTPTPGPLTAFPGAEGFGRYSVGGRGGRVIEVVNLNNSGTGSLRECVIATGPRVCVFRVAGTITLTGSLRIQNPFITIAGQTAPGDGITVKGQSVIVQTNDVILRYLRFRRGPGGEGDSLWVFTTSKDVIIDHVSASWGTDENLSVTGSSSDVTLSWNIISEGLYDSTNAEGPHSMGSLITDGPQRITVVHNLYAHNDKRTPRTGGDVLVEVVNNISYDWRTHAVDIADDNNSGVTKVHVLNNYFKLGTDDTVEVPILIERTTKPESRVFISGNLGPSPLVRNAGSSNIPVSENVFAPSVMEIVSADQTYLDVLEFSGNSRRLDCDGVFIFRRDAVDTRIVQDVKDRTGEIIDDPSQVGGWPVLAPGSSCADGDKDGMPDVWELDKGLNPASNDSAGDQDGDGYTNLEEYLNG